MTDKTNFIDLIKNNIILRKKKHLEYTTKILFPVCVSQMFFENT